MATLWRFESSSRHQPENSRAILPAVRTCSGLFSTAFERMPQDDGLLAVGPGRNHVDRHAAGFLHALEIMPRRLRQVLETPDADGAFGPARESLRRSARILPVAPRPTGRMSMRFAIDAVADADLQRLPCRPARRAWSRTSPDTPLIWIERFSAAASNQPQRRGRPVSEPNSLPRVRELLARCRHRARSGTDRSRPASCRPW